MVIALLFILRGGTMIGAAATVLLGLVVEVIAYAGGYRSRWAAITPYPVFGMAGFIPVPPMITDREAYFGTRPGNRWTRRWCTRPTSCSRCR